MAGRSARLKTLPPNRSSRTASLPVGRFAGQEQRISQLENESGVRFQRDLGMAYQQMNGDSAGTDETAGECADRSPDDGSDHGARTDSPAVFNAIALDAGVWLDGAFTGDMGAGA